MERSVPGPAAKRPPKRAGALPEVNSRQLAAVLAIAEYRSFIAAAAYLGISQPALTLTIKRLEQTLGLPLFLRTTRQVTITAAGREFVAMAERVFNDLKLSMRSLRELTEQQRGQVIVTSLIPVRMSDVIAEYGRRFPGVEIQLREGFQDDVRDDVRSGLADFGVGDIGDLPDSHLTESLGVEELWVVLRDDHPLARLRQIEFGALKDVALVSYRVGSTTRRLIDAAATAAGFTLRHVVTVGLPLTLMNLVGRGVGVAVGPARPWPPGGHPNLVSRPLVRPRLSSEIGIMRLRDRELSPAAAGLLALARERLRIHRSR
ncbi:LysR family transcriptional regulator [Bradyrhizobium erythrophlei]|uniref:Transcriptional regulator, LysR family n=1 Tax=Bradyrhizobium erythrophlei TaxID=1437360 RepID=A0A1M5LSN3_9BRAD|nr:LysR family transcriptional regulator [Bradyrhizobium erythrophlei]SHG67629.1 transcriptional regulator, LysR family [Bradyrhizobium erythrophlei]